MQERANCFRCDEQYRKLAESNEPATDEDGMGANRKLPEPPTSDRAALAHGVEYVNERYIHDQNTYLQRAGYGGC